MGELFVRADGARSIAELAHDTGIPVATVSREVARLERFGIVRSARRGRLRLVEADNRLPWFAELRSLLLKTIGPAAVLRDALATVDGVEEAWIFGSWAARYRGDVGPPPNDVDLLVIGAPDLDALYAACRRAERELRLEVNPVTRTRGEWEKRDRGFLDEIRRGPRVAVADRR